MRCYSVAMEKSISDIANELFAEQPKGTLYHYTSLAAMQSIIGSRSLRVSDVRYFNDVAEIEHASDLLQSAAHAQQTDDTRWRGARWHLELKGFARWLSMRDIGLYVGSFTENGNLLSQWRGYCPPSRGVSIGFRAADLSESAQQQGFSIGRCIYSRERKRQIAGAVAEALGAPISEWLRAADVGQHPLYASGPRGMPDFRAIGTPMVADWFRIASLLKHSAFEEEDEWRIISPAYDSHVAPPVEYREGKSMLIPSLTFQLPSTSDRDVAVQRVYLGPTQHEHLSISSLSHYLMKAGARPLEGVFSSGLPLRET